MSSLMVRNTIAAVVVASLLACSSAFASIMIQNVPTGGSISSFGAPDSMTYGQVFTAPITGTLDSFTLWLNGGVGALHGAVGTWNGTPTFGLGFGEASNLYTSASVASIGAGSYTFAPGVSVTAGNRYVAYLSVFGEPGAFTNTSMPLGVNSPGIDYFVWNNSTCRISNTFSVVKQGRHGGRDALGRGVRRAGVSPPRSLTQEKPRIFWQ